ncbi:MAG TPA: aldose epimerase family protein [Sphingomonas sp.]|nr:aldose epimerase family protein [Sphingomonas sp.]HEU0045906.1 aldose epimerase family protein [Sphingomonas sp.]
MGITRRGFGHMPGGDAVEAITLTNGRGTAATIISYGATLQALVGPDSRGEMADVVLGYPALEGYLSGRDYLGATVGRVANRIAGGRFVLDGIEYRLTRNNGKAHLHGGEAGFDRALWAVDGVTELATSASVTLSHLSVDGDEGYPGRVEVEARYTLDDEDRLTIAYRATTDRPTIVNLTNHALFDAAGEGSPEGALGNVLTLAADAYLEVDADLIPVGPPRKVAGTAFDFRQPRVIGSDTGATAERAAVARRYDHNMVLPDNAARAVRLVARLEDPLSGRAIEFSTDQPGLQLYTGGFLDGTTHGKRGNPYRAGDGVAMEPQHFPDAPNRPDFPSIRLDPGAVYQNRSVLAFAAR